MAYDRFMINQNASLGYNYIISGGCMSRENRADIKDILGQKFGLLTVIAKKKLQGRRGTFWVCKCDCGTECIAYGGHLRGGTRKSCGCLQYLNINPTGVNRLMAYYKRKSSLKAREFSLGFEQFSYLISSRCAYCGIEPSQILKRLKTDNIQIIYNGIDRVDSSKGYFFDNCVPCCRICNQAKSILTVEQFKDHIKRIYKWLMIDS